MTTRDRTAIPGVSEAQFQTKVIATAAHMGWRCYHTFDSRRSAAGFPDLVLVRGGDVIFAELKTESGRLRAGQREWLTALRKTHNSETYLWRPSDFDAIASRLTESSRPARADDEPHGLVGS